MQTCRRSQKFQQFGFGGIAPECLINIPCSNICAQLRFHDDYILCPVQTEHLGQQFRHKTIEVPHPAYIAQRKASHIGVLFTQVICSRHCRPLFGTSTDGLADLTIHLHLGQISGNCKIQCSVHSTIVDFFPNVHGFSFPAQGTLFPFKAEKNTASCHAFLCFEVYMI